jgi:uncharacterized DUF497 family protein
MRTVGCDSHAAQQTITPRGKTIRVNSLRRAKKRDERAYANERQPS